MFHSPHANRSELFWQGEKILVDDARQLPYLTWLMESKYHDPRWQKFRLERLELAEWSCDLCGTAKIKLNIHHSYYVAGRAPWEYPKETTMVLCDFCHACMHEDDGEDKPTPTKFPKWETTAAKLIRQAIINHRKKMEETTSVR